MKRVAVVAVCDFISKPNGGEVFLLHNLLSEKIFPDLQYFLIGMTFDENMKVGEWQEIDIDGNYYRFFPIAKVLKDKEKTHIPFRLRCVHGLKKYWKKINNTYKIDEWYIHSAELAMPLRNKKEISFVYHVHGDPSQTLQISRFPFFRTKFWTTLYLSQIRKTMQGARKIIWAADRSKKLYLEKQPQMKDCIEQKSCVVHSSFDMRLIVDPTLQIKLCNDRKHLITVGRLSKVKRIDFIIQVFGNLIQKNQPIDLIICGDGEERVALEEQVQRLHLEKLVHFIGVADRSKLATLLDQADAFLFASENEAMSLVVLESLYMGTPVVSTDVGDIPHVVLNDVTGMIIDGYDEEKFEEAIMHVLRNGKEYYLDNCKKMAMNFTPKQMAENIRRELLQ